MTTLDGQVAVVTGASSGIGKAITLGLAARGATLCLVGRNPETLQSVADAGTAAGARRVGCYRADLANHRELEELGALLTRDHPQVDILVHSAGVFTWGALEASGVDQLDHQYHVNVRAPYVLTRELLPALKRCQGQIVFVNSSVALAAKANVSQYAASKQALKAVAECLRAEVNPAGVRILNLYLGRTATPMQAAVHALEHRVYEPEKLMQPEDVAAVVLRAIAVPRSIEVTDISMRPSLRSY